MPMPSGQSARCASREERCAAVVADQDAWIARLLEGDDEAARCLMAVVGARLSSAVRRLLSGDADVEDVVQEAYLRAFRALPGFRGDALLSTWLHRIAVNCALMHLRARGRRPEVPLDMTVGLGKHVMWSGPSPESAAIHRQTTVGVRDAINRLPAGYRAAVERVHLGEAPLAQAAAELGVTRNALKIRTLRGRRALKARLIEAGVVSHEGDSTLRRE